MVIFHSYGTVYQRVSWHKMGGGIESYSHLRKSCYRFWSDLRSLRSPMFIMFHPFDLLFLIVFLRNWAAQCIKNPEPSRRSMSQKTRKPGQCHSIICHPLLYHCFILGICPMKLPHLREAEALSRVQIAGTKGGKGIIQDISWRAGRILMGNVGKTL